MNNEVLGWISDVSLFSLSKGGSKKGSVPVHANPGLQARRPVYLNQMHACDGCPDYLLERIALIINASAEVEGELGDGQFIPQEVWKDFYDSVINLFEVQGG